MRWRWIGLNNAWWNDTIDAIQRVSRSLVNQSLEMVEDWETYNVYKIIYFELVISSKTPENVTHVARPIRSSSISHCNVNTVTDAIRIQRQRFSRNTPHQYLQIIDYTHNIRYTQYANNKSASIFGDQLHAHVLSSRPSAPDSFARFLKVTRRQLNTLQIGNILEWYAQYNFYDT